MKWDKFRISTTTEAEDLISSMLADCGIEGVEIEDNVPLSSQDLSEMFIDFPADLPEDDGTSHIIFYLEAGTDHTKILDKVRSGLKELGERINIGEASIEESTTEDIDWENNWKEFFHPFYVDDIYIRPVWEKEEPDREVRTVIEIDPGISFGTGKHETTQLCIRELEKYIQPGYKVLDLGCGSGILSVVSLKLGADHVVGTDIDEDCIGSAYENFETNHLDKNRCEFIRGNLITDKDLQKRLGNGKFDLVTANILADVIIPMAPFIGPCMKKDGILICSGIIDFKEDEVRRALEENEFHILSIGHLGEWVSITADKK